MLYRPRIGVTCSMSPQPSAFRQHLPAANSPAQERVRGYSEKSTCIKLHGVTSQQHVRHDTNPHSHSQYDGQQTRRCGPRVGKHLTNDGMRPWGQFVTTAAHHGTGKTAPGLTERTLRYWVDVVQRLARVAKSVPHSTDSSDRTVTHRTLTLLRISNVPVRTPGLVIIIGFLLLS